MGLVRLDTTPALTQLRCHTGRYAEALWGLPQLWITAWFERERPVLGSEMDWRRTGAGHGGEARPESRLASVAENYG